MRARARLREDVVARDMEVGTVTAVETAASVECGILLVGEISRVPRLIPRVCCPVSGVRTRPVSHPRSDQNHVIQR